MTFKHYTDVQNRLENGPMGEDAQIPDREMQNSKLQALSNQYCPECMIQNLQQSEIESASYNQSNMVPMHISGQDRQPPDLICDGQDADKSIKISLEKMSSTPEDKK